MANEYRKTESWIYPTVLLCLCGVFNYLKPSEPFLTPYLMGPEQNLTSSQLVNSVYPVWIYSYLASLIPVFLITDYVKYKPVIIAQGIGYISCWLLLCFASGVPMMQLMQFCYGVATAGEIGYYSYIYTIVETNHYQKVTSYVRASTLLGLFIGSVLSQMLYSLAHLSYYYLHIISLVNVSIAFLISLFLPIPKKTIFFYISDNESTASGREELQVEEESEDLKQSTAKKHEKSKTFKAVVLDLLGDLKVCYTNKVLLRWSVWWALSTCGWILVVNYVQNLWETILPSRTEVIYNGAVETVATVFGALGAFCIGFVKLNWNLWGELALGFFSLLKFALLMLIYWTDNIWICYSAYVIFIILYNVVITITQ
uniref:Thiamine transporter 1-like n=1 Tax=Phallusia mammillata TaxID=59560 RepID=A0A6F9DSY2_9ASCI|nr:thiamine transporter 1-like [Phallusia mammillata]